MELCSYFNYLVLSSSEDNCGMRLLSIGIIFEAVCKSDAEVLISLFGLSLRPVQAVSGSNSTFTR